MKTKNSHKAKLGVTWFGHSAFLLKTPGGKSVLIDPWLDNPKAPEGARNIAPIDVILVTHGHSDHVGNTVEVARRTKAPVVSIFEISLYLQKQGVAAAQGMNKGGTIRFNGLKITMVDAKHSADLYKPHMAILPIGGLYTMDPREAAYACKLLKPKHIVGMHYGTFPVLEGTPGELKKLLPAALKKNVLELVPGKEIAV